MSNVIKREANGHIRFFCPACKHNIIIPTQETSGTGVKWEFNGNLEKPTVSPSILTRWTEGEEKIKKVCHSFIRNGQIEYLQDCTHELAGKTVPLKEIE